MAVIKPPITGDSTLDSWTNQITQTINAGVSTGSSPSVGARGSSGPSGFNTATISLFARTTTNSAPTAMNEQVTYFYTTTELTNGSNHNGYTNGIGPGDVWFRKVNAGSGDFIWTTTVSVADTNDVEIIAADSWSAVALISTSGENVKNKIFAQDGIPTALQIGDLWIDTNDNNKVYIAKAIGANEIASNEWVLAQDSVAAQARADLAMSQLGDIAADNKITPSEKLAIKNIWDSILGEYAGIIASAVDSGVATNHAKYTAYTAAYASLYAYLVTGTPSINLFQANGSLSSGSSTQTVDRAIWNVRFKAYYDSRQGLLDFIAATLKDLADLALTKLSDIAADSKVTPSEKLIVKTLWDSIRGEYAGIIASAVDSGVATNHAKYTAYTTAYGNLTTYLVSGTGSINMFQSNGTLNGPSNTHTVVRSTWDSRFKAYYDSRQGLLDFIAATLKDAADAAAILAGTKANVFYQDASPIPTALKVGDLWYNLDQTFNGTPNLYIAQSVGANQIVTNEWVRKDFVELINNNITTIDGGHISTGSITSAKIDVGEIEADRLNINGLITFNQGGAYRFGKDTPQDQNDGVFLGNPSGASEFAISYETGNGSVGSAANVKKFYFSEGDFELTNPTISTGATTTQVINTGSTSNIVIPSTAQSLTVIAIAGGGGGGGGQSDTSNNNISGVVGATGGATTANINNSLTNVSASGGTGGLSGSNIGAGSGAGASGTYGTGGSQGSAGNTGGAGGNAGGYGAGGGGSGSRNYGGWLNSGQDAVTNGGGGQAGSVHVSGPHNVSSLGEITISGISVGSGGAGGNGNAAAAGGTGSAGRIIVNYTTTSLTAVHLLTAAQKTVLDNADLPAAYTNYGNSSAGLGRNNATWYRNTTGGPIYVNICSTGGGHDVYINAGAASTSGALRMIAFGNGTGHYEQAAVGFIVPHNYYYYGGRHNNGDSAWVELR